MAVLFCSSMIYSLKHKLFGETSHLCHFLYSDRTEPHKYATVDIIIFAPFITLDFNLCAGQTVLPPSPTPTPGQPRGQRKNVCDKKQLKVKCKKGGALENEGVNVINEGGAR